MSGLDKIASALVISCCLAGWSFGQAATTDRFDATVQLGEIKTELGQLDQVLTKKLPNVSVSIDQQAIKTAGLSPSTKIAAKIGPMPLKSTDHNRFGIVVTTAYYKHEQIAELLASIRRSQVGPDPGN